MVLEQTLIGVAMGLVMGLFGYFSSREFDPSSGFEGFNYAKIGRTVVIYGAAGALVGYAGDPLTQGRIEAATTSTVFLGELAERAIKGAYKQRKAKQAA